MVTPDTDWFSDPPNTVKLHILEWLFIVTSLRETRVVTVRTFSHRLIDLLSHRLYRYHGGGGGGVV